MLAWQAGGGCDGWVGGSRGARVTTVSTNAAAVDARQKIQRLAAEFWGWPEEQITMENGFLVQGTSGEKVSIEDVMARYGGSVSGDDNAYASPVPDFHLFHCDWWPCP